MPKPFLWRGVAFLFLLPVSWGTLRAQNTQLTVLSGTTLTVAGNHVVLSNTDLHCDGSLNGPAATVWVTGSSSTSFGGAGVPLIGTLQLNDSSGDTLTLSNTLQVTSLVNFHQGVINLNGQQLQLAGSAFLQGESEASHITALNGGTVTASAIGVNSPSQLNVGNLGAVLTSGADLGILTVSRIGKPVNDAGSNVQGIDRSYLIQPQNDAGLNATLRFYYLNEELNGKDTSSLSLWMSIDGVSWTNVGADTHNSAEKYVEKSGINALSLWTLSDVISPLPLTLLTFSASCEGGNALIQWHTGVEGDLVYFLVQGSADGQQWTTLGKVEATDNPQGSAYSYQDPHPSANSYYRLLITEKSGEVSYSPVFRGGCSDVTLPFTLYPNPAQTQTAVQLSVRQNTPATLQLIDMAGHLLHTVPWGLQTGVNTYTLPLGTLPAGMYIVRLVLPGTTLQTNLIKQ
jgi:hypothetical protein